MKHFWIVCLLLASSAFAAPPTLKLPGEVKGEPGTFIAIRAESDAEWVNFRADPGLAVFPAGLLSDRKATVLTAARPGRYKLFAYTGNDEGGADVEVLIIVGNAPVVVTPPVVDPTDPVVDPVTPITKATAATLVYEKDEHAITSGVLAGLNRLNREKKIRATLFEVDTTDGTGDIPEQYKVAVAAAKQTGLPVLIVTAGEKVINVVKNPKTEADVTGAVQ